MRAAVNNEIIAEMLLIFFENINEITKIIGKSMRVLMEIL